MIVHVIMFVGNMSWSILTRLDWSAQKPLPQDGTRPNLRAFRWLRLVDIQGLGFMIRRSRCLSSPLTYSTIPPDSKYCSSS